MLKRALSVMFVAWLLVGCSTHSYLYKPLPDYLVPIYPAKLPSIQSSALTCLSDDAYESLVARDRQLRQYADEARALFESKP